MKRILTIIFVVVALLGVVQLGFYLHATTSPQWKYAKRALSCGGSNYDLRYCMDLPKGARKDYTNSSWKPLPCINTATSFYDDKYRAGNCNKFKSNPERWGFKEINEEEALPGDLILFLRKNNDARHAGVYTMNSLLGPLCANTSDPTFKGVFLHYMPIKPLLFVHAGGYAKVCYYRYNKL